MTAEPLNRPLVHQLLVASLSEREREVLRLAFTGMRATSIARELHLSPSTVRSHLSNAYRKLEVDGYDELVASYRDQLLSGVVNGDPDSVHDDQLDHATLTQAPPELEYLVKLADAASAILGLFDRSGRLLWLNEAGRALCCTEGPGTAECNLWGCFPVEHHPALRSGITEAFATGVWSQPITLLDGSDHRRLSQVSFLPYPPDSDRAIVMFVHRLVARP